MLEFNIYIYTRAYMCRSGRLTVCLARVCLPGVYPARVRSPGVRLASLPRPDTRCCGWARELQVVQTIINKASNQTYCCTLITLICMPQFDT